MGDAGLRGGERQAAAGDKIDILRIAPELEHDRAERPAGQSFQSRPQAAIRIGRAHDHNALRIETEIEQPRHRKLAERERREILANPENGTAAGNPYRQSGRKTRGRHALPFLRCEDFMQDAGFQPALQDGIRARMPERYHGIGPNQRLGFEAGNGSPQGGQGSRGITHDKVIVPVLF